MPRFVHFLCHFGVFVTVNIHKTQAQCGLRNYRETLIKDPQNLFVYYELKTFANKKHINSFILSILC
jgi:hypothetical protein